MDVVQDKQAILHKVGYLPSEAAFYPGMKVKDVLKLSPGLRKKDCSAGVGLGIAAMMYFLNLIANIAEVAKFLKYITPFGYCEGADIVSNGSLDSTMVAIGMAIGIAGISVAYLHYTKKDI